MIEVSKNKFEAVINELKWMGNKIYEVGAPNLWTAYGYMKNKEFIQIGQEIYLGKYYLNKDETKGK